MVDVVKRRTTGLADANSDDLVEVNMSPITAITFSTGLPDTTTVATGANLTLTVALTGGITPYRVQWFKNGTQIQGASGLTYTKTSATAADAGVYKAVAKDEFGNLIADQTTVTVTA